MKRAFASCFALVLLVAGSACFSACSSDPSSSTGVGNPGLSKDEEALVDDGNDANDSGSTASTITGIPTYALSALSDVANETTAATKAANSTALFLPPSCVTSSVSGAMVTYTFGAGSVCNGVLGLLNVKGHLDVTFSNPTATGIDFHVASEADFTLEGRAVVITADATLTFDGSGNKTLAWNGHYEGTTLRGYKVVHEPKYTIAIDTSAGCVTVDGSAKTTITRAGMDYVFNATVTSYHHCGPRAACPDGGTLHLATPDGKLDLTVEFLPGRLANISTPHGVVKNWPLKCT